jgi:hypothetical protein
LNSIFPLLSMVALLGLLIGWGAYGRVPNVPLPSKPDKQNLTNKT